MSPGAEVIKDLTELWFCKEIPRTVLRIKEHHVFNWIQKEFTYSGRNGAEGEQRRKDTHTHTKIKARYWYQQLETKVKVIKEFLYCFPNIFMSQHTSKLEELKDENKSKRIHCQDTFVKILITSKINYLGEILVEDGQILWNSGSNRTEGCIMSMIWKTQHCQCQSSSNCYDYS